MRKGLIIGLLMICLLINVVSATTSFTSYVLNNTGHSWSFPSNASLTSAQVYNQTWLNFDGVNDKLVLGNYSNINNANQNFTIIAKLKVHGTANPPNQGLFSKSNESLSANATGFYSNINTNGKISFAYYNETNKRKLLTTGSDIFSNETITTIAFSLNLNNLTIYKDGSLVSTASGVGGMTPCLNKNLTFGLYSYVDSIPFNGTLYSVIVLDYSLSPEQIKLIYNAEI